MSKYLKEVILKIKVPYKSLLCIFNFMGPGYLMSEMIRIRNDCEISRAQEIEYARRDIEQLYLKNYLF